MIETKIKNKLYYKLVCERCNNEFKRRKNEFLKNLNKCNGKILCCNCMKARKYKDLKYKICSKCKERKPVENFYKRKKDKAVYCSQCKECMNNNNKNWRRSNKEILKERQKEYRSNNKEKVFECSKKWKENNKETIRKYKIKTYYKNKNDKFYKLKMQTRNLIFKAFERKRYRKNSKTEVILGCNFETFVKHLLKTYKDNYGKDWDGQEQVHIDHIIPLSTAKNEEEVIKLNCYTNLQLLKMKDNLHKSNKLNWKLQGGKK